MKKFKTKAVAFDFDDTLYSGVNWSFWYDHCKNSVKKIIGPQPPEKQKIIDEALQKEKFGDHDAIALLEKFGMGQKEWVKWRTYNKAEDAYKHFEDAKAIKKEVLAKFAKNFPLYIVTNNYIDGMNMIANALGIDLSVFKGIITATSEYPTFSKKYRYLKICELENIKPEELFVIGDSITDIEPAYEIGARGKQVENCQFKFEDFDL